jgi:putative ABC transport system substrate-binding protein
VKRREFITLLGGAAVGWPVAANAQQAAKVPRIGWLGQNLAPNHEGPEPFRQGLRDLGYVEGRDFVIEYRDAEGKFDRRPSLAAELVALNVDVIVAPIGVAALAAKQATRTIPIVFTSVADPVTDGVVTSLARPGGNVTGLSIFNPELVGKCLQLLTQAVPGLSRVAALWAQGTYGERVESVPDQPWLVLAQTPNLSKLCQNWAGSKVRIFSLSTVTLTIV